MPKKRIPRILITGGKGALGYELTRKLLACKYEVCTYDKFQEYMFGVPIEDEVDCPSFQTWIEAYKLFKPNIIIHLAEAPFHGSIGDGVSVVDTNITLTTAIVKQASLDGVQTIIGTWKHTERNNNKHLWNESINFKRTIVTNYNRGNGVNLLFPMPRIISKYHDASLYGNIVRRTFDTVHSDKDYMLVYENELKTPTHYTIADKIIEVILLAIPKRQRGELEVVTKIPIVATQLIAHTLYTMFVPAIKIMTERSYEEKIKAKEFNVSPYYRKQIDDCINYWYKHRTS